MFRFLALVFLLAHVASIANAAAPAGGASSRRSQRKSSAFPGYEAHAPLIKTATQQNFRELVMEPTLPVVYTVYTTTDCPHCAAAAEMIVNASKAMEGIVLFVAQDGSTEEGKALMQMFGVTQVPNLLFFNPEMLPVEGQAAGSYMKYPEGYASGELTTDRIVSWAIRKASSSHFFPVADEDDLHHFVVDVFGRLDLPKVLLLTAPEIPVSPRYRALSHLFRYRAVFGVSKTPAVHTLIGAGDVVLPAIAVFTADSVVPEVTSIAGMTQAQAGELLGRVVASTERRAIVQVDYMVLENEYKQKLETESKKVRALPVVVARNREDFKTACTRRPKGVCVLCFVEDPNSEQTLAMLEQAAEKMAQRGTIESQIVVVDGAKNWAIAQFFQSSENGFPSVVFINPAKKTYAKHIGAFSERGIVSFWADRYKTAKQVVYKTKGGDSAFPKFVASDASSDAPDSGSEHDGGAPSAAPSVAADDIAVGDEL